MKMKCPACDRDDFVSERAVRSHIAWAHKELSQKMKEERALKQKQRIASADDAADSTQIQATSVTHPSDWQPQQSTSFVVCPVCQQRFKNDNALRSHMPSHPIEANNRRRRELLDGNLS